MQTIGAAQSAVAALSASAYNKLLVIAIIIVLVLLLNQIVITYWRLKWPTGDTPLPGILVFPRIELIVLKVS